MAPFWTEEAIAQLEYPGLILVVTSRVKDSAGHHVYGPEPIPHGCFAPTQGSSRPPPVPQRVARIRQVVERGGEVARVESDGRDGGWNAGPFGASIFRNWCPVSGLRPWDAGATKVSHNAQRNRLFLAPKLSVRRSPNFSTKYDNYPFSNSRFKYLPSSPGSVGSPAKSAEGT